MNAKVLRLLIISAFYTSLLAQTPSGPLNYSGVSNLIIQNKVFTSTTAAACINLNNCTNIKIQNCTFNNIPSMIGVQISNSSNIEIIDCDFYSFRGGVYAINSSSIKVTCSYFETIVGPKPRGQIVQFNNVSGAGNRINYNRLEHTLGDGDPEDLINCYGSSGTSADPLQIIGNHLHGGGPSTSGGGIMVGDNGGHDFLISDNILVDPGQYGIAAPSGYNITIQNNKVFGKQQSFTNVGIYVGLQSEINAGFACTPSTIKVLNNQVNWTNKNGIKNGFYNCPCCSGITSSGNNFNSTSINASILPAAFPVGACPSVSLPLQWLNFSAEWRNSKVYLNWQTAQERDIKLFNIQRSTDGVNFTTIESQLPKGTASGEYEAMDSASSGDVLYYRIECINTNDPNNYSEIMKVVASASSISIFPNPTDGILFINASENNYYDIKVLTLLGVLIQEQKSNSATLQINVANLEKGVYQLLVSSREHRYHLRFVRD